MNTVIILLSTYNGEKYLKEQIDSLLNQKGVDIRIIARDDGSKDSTISILSEYQKNNENFSYYQGANCGPAKSFLHLISCADAADYYALCDQDDVWDEDKLLSAINKLNKLNSQKPNLYYSNLRIVDEHLNFYRFSHSGVLHNDNRFSALTENLCTGCTAVFNRKAKEMIGRRLPDFCSMHDTWIYMTCMLMGNTIYDEDAHISYRQHSSNVVGTYLEKSRSKVILEKVKRMFNKELQPRYVNAQNFYECYKDVMDNECKSKVLEVVNYKKSFKDRMKLFFDKDIKATTGYGNLRFRLHVLWGTV